MTLHQRDRDFADLQRAMDLAVVAGAKSHQLQAVIIDGEPIPKSRARVGRGGRHFTPQRTVDAELDVARRFDSPGESRFKGNIAVAIIFYRSNNHRVDIDNLMKTVLDGITKSGSVWADDDQVTALLGVLEYDREHPRTIVALGHHTSTLRRGDDRLTHTCETCEKKYKPHSEVNQPSRYCSRACRPSRVQICSDCGGPTSHPSVKRCRACADVFRSPTI